MEDNMIKTTYADTCVLHNTDKGQDVEAEIINFSPRHSITVSINRQIKVTLLYRPQKDIYVGSMAGYEFTTTGPEETITYQGRRR